jgi:hypothetical protein
VKNKSELRRLNLEILSRSIVDFVTPVTALCSKRTGDKASGIALLRRSDSFGQRTSITDWVYSTVLQYQGGVQRVACSAVAQRADHEKVLGGDVSTFEAGVIHFG